MTLICYHFVTVFFQWLEAWAVQWFLVQLLNQRIQTSCLVHFSQRDPAASAKILAVAIFVIQRLPCPQREGLVAAVSPAGCLKEALTGVVEADLIV